MWGHNIYIKALRSRNTEEVNRNQAMAFLNAVPVIRSFEGSRVSFSCGPQRRPRVLRHRHVRCSLGDAGDAGGGDGDAGLDVGMDVSAPIATDNGVVDFTAVDSGGDASGAESKGAAGVDLSGSKAKFAADAASDIAAPADVSSLGTPVPGGTDSTVPFELRGFSLGNIFLYTGLVITVTSLYSYLISSGTAGVTSLGFVYGVPVTLVGCALKYAELEPVRLNSDAKAPGMRKSLATATQQQIVKDITRHRYGDEAHLQPALSALGLIARGQPCPKLIAAYERIIGGEYVLEMDFISLNTPYARWEEQIPKYEQFFGPNIKAQMTKISEEERICRLSLSSVTNT